MQPPTVPPGQLSPHKNGAVSPTSVGLSSIWKLQSLSKPSQSSTGKVHVLTLALQSPAVDDGCGHRSSQPVTSMPPVVASSAGLWRNVRTPGWFLQEAT